MITLMRFVSTFAWQEIKLRLAKGAIRGDSLPTPTSRTVSWRVVRRGESVGGGAAGMPSPTLVTGAAPQHRCVPRKRAVPHCIVVGARHWNSLIGFTRSAVTVSSMYPTTNTRTT